MRDEQTLEPGPADTVVSVEAGRVPHSSIPIGGSLFVGSFGTALLRRCRMFGRRKAVKELEQVVVEMKSDRSY